MVATAAHQEVGAPGVLDTDASRRALQAFLDAENAIDALRWAARPKEFQKEFMEWHAEWSDTAAQITDNEPQVKALAEIPVHYWRVRDPFFGERIAPMVLLQEGYRLDWEAFVARGERNWEDFLDQEEVPESRMRLLATVPARFSGNAAEVDQLDLYHPQVMNMMTAHVRRGEDRANLFAARSHKMSEFPVTVELGKRNGALVINEVVALDWLTR